MVEWAMSPSIVKCMDSMLPQRAMGITQRSTTTITHQHRRITSRSIPTETMMRRLLALKIVTPRMGALTSRIVQIKGKMCHFKAKPKVGARNLLIITIPPNLLLVQRQRTVKSQATAIRTGLKTQSMIHTRPPLIRHPSCKINPPFPRPVQETAGM